MTLMQRRRAIMAAQASSSIPLSTLPAGTEVQIEESGVLKPWVYLGQYSDGCCALLRAECLSQTARMRPVSAAQEAVDYDGMERDVWLEGTYKGVFGASLVAALAPHQIQYYIWDGVALSVGTITRDIYLASLYEMGGGGSEGGTDFLSSLETYKSATGNAARKAVLEGTATYTAWFLRSAHNSYNRIKCCSNAGAIDFMQTTTVSGIRPMLSLNASAPVTETNDGYVVCL